MEKRPGKKAAAEESAYHGRRAARAGSEQRRRAILEAALRQIGFGGETLELTSRGGEGFAAWLAWLEREVSAQRERTARGATARWPPRRACRCRPPPITSRTSTT